MVKPDENICRDPAGVYLQKKMTERGFSVASEVVSTERARINQPRSAQRELIELAVGYGLILATIWTVNPMQRVLYWLAFAWIVATSWKRHDSLTTLGLGRKGLLQSLWIVVVALILSAIAVFIAARSHTLHRLHGPTPILLHGWGYIVWSLMQQFLLQSYFLLRFMRLVPGKPVPIIAATGIFALAHLPNPILTPLTLVWGVISCVLFLRYRNIYTLGLAHGIMGLCVAVTVPSSLHHHMRVGRGYLRYHPSRRDRLQSDDQIPSLHRSQIDHNVSTDAWVIADAPTLRS